jgi:Plasmid pRiA4b ORF-3-like protein
MFLEVMQDPRHPGYDAMLEWLGERCDPEAFDLDALNRELKPLT